MNAWEERYLHNSGCPVREDPLRWDEIAFVTNGSLYLATPPCFGCARRAVAGGARRVVHIREPQDDEKWAEVRTFLERAGVEVVGRDRSVLNRDDRIAV